MIEFSYPGNLGFPWFITRNWCQGMLSVSQRKMYTNPWVSKIVWFSQSQVNYSQVLDSYQQVTKNTKTNIKNKGFKNQSINQSINRILYLQTTRLSMSNSERIYKEATTVLHEFNRFLDIQSIHKNELYF